MQHIVHSMPPEYVLIGFGLMFTGAILIIVGIALLIRSIK
jgi:hypothetical protein